MVQRANFPNSDASDVRRVFQENGVFFNLANSPLNHNPANCMELMKYPWQWMLAGHTHGRPMEEMKIRGKIVRKGRPFVGGYYEVEPGRHLYVNRGLSYGDGRHGANRPEITVFRLSCVKDDASAGKLV